MRIPYGFYFLLGTLLPASDKQMLLLRFTSFNVHELVEFQYPPLAAAPAFAAFVEHWRAGMMHAALVRSRTAFELVSTTFPPTCHALLDLSCRVIVFGLLDGLRCSCAWCCCLGSWEAGYRRGERRLGGAERNGGI